MSSSIQYNPNPPRVWSRVQNPCSTFAYNNNDPAANSNFSTAEYERQMLIKGNVLQYKKNSSNLTKKQRYTQIAKGMWTNRTKTWATQSDTYTNPNTTSLLRINYTILDPSNNNFSSRSNPFGCPTTTIQDGGNLVCNTIVNPCTQKIVKRTKSQQLCNPTSDSDVPGHIQQLCWNDGTQTWYPRQRYIMPTSGTKWPTNYKDFTSALTFVGPVLSVGNIACGQLYIPLSWTFLDSTCAPITNFNIYQNGALIQTVPVSQTSIIITGNPAGIYTYYITSVSNTFESEKSNTIIVSTNYGYISKNAVITNSGKTITFLENGSIIFYCDANIKYTLVGGGASGGIYSQGSNAGSTAGGGGQVLNCNSPLLIVSGTDLNVIIGKGGMAPKYEATGNIGGDTSIHISGLYTVSTDNTTYGGVGGKGAVNKSYSGGGGTLNSNNSDGGNYATSTNNIGFGSGGAAGSLTEVNTAGAIISVTKPSLGGNASNTSAGNGSNGFQGINGVYYGGGGGGGQQYNSSYSGGTGGLGGGGNGANANGVSSIPTVNNNTGGGGGGGVSGYYPNPAQILLPANGGSGIAIIMVM